MGEGFSDFYDENVKPSLEGAIGPANSPEPKPKQLNLPGLYQSNYDETSNYALASF